MRRNDFASQFRPKRFDFILGKIKEWGQRFSIWKTCVRISQFVKERMAASFDGEDSLVGGVLQQFGNDVDGLGWSVRTEDLSPGVRFHLRELEFCVILVHGFDLLSCWSSQDFDNLHELIDAALSGK